MKKRIYVILIIVALIAGIGVFLSKKKEAGNGQPTALRPLSLRLEWVPQAQFAGYIVAKDLGYYKDKGLDVDLRPAGPDLKPQVSVASGTDDIGIGVSNQVISARSNGVPLKIIAQIMQDSANRYVLKRKNAINSLQQLKGKKVGLWLGGDEVEFVAMLKTTGMTLRDVQAIPQEFSVTPFLQDQYVLSEVTVYNELNQIRAQGYDGDKLQVLSPKDYNSAIVSDMLFTTEQFIKAHPQELRDFLSASMKGWQYCYQHPDQAVDIILKYNSELKRDDQKKQLMAVLQLISSGEANTKGMGAMNPSDYATADHILFDSGQINTHVDPKSVFDDSVWKQLRQEETAIPTVK